MAECLTNQARSNIAPLDSIAAHAGINITEGYTITPAGAPLEPMDRETGQIIIQCEVDGCAAELEVYPNNNTSGIYDVAANSLKAARFVCTLNQKKG